MSKVKDDLLNYLRKDEGRGKSLSFRSDSSRPAGRSFLWKSLQSRSENPSYPDYVTLDEEGETVRIEEVDRFGNRLEYEKTRPFMPSPLLHHTGKSELDVEGTTDE